MKEIFKDIKNIIGSIAEDFHNGKWILGILEIIILVMAGASIVLVVILICQQVYNNIDYIILAILGFFIVVALWRHFFPPQPQQQVEMPVENNTMVYNPAFLEDTYSMLLTNISPIIMEKADIMQLQRIMASYELECPIHYTIKGFVLYHILIGKINENVDTQKVLEILQNAISQKLSNSGFIGIGEAYYLYNGRALPRIMIDNVRDLGNFVQVDIVITDEAYCQYYYQRLQNKISNASVSKPRDRDF